MYANFVLWLESNKTFIIVNIASFVLDKAYFFHINIF